MSDSKGHVEVGLIDLSSNWGYYGDQSRKTVKEILDYVSKDKRGGIGYWTLVVRLRWQFLLGGHTLLDQTIGKLNYTGMNIQRQCSFCKDIDIGF